MLTADYPPHTWSGIGHAVARQAQALADLGVEVHVLCEADAARSRDEDSHGGPVVHALDRYRCPVDPGQFDLVHLHSLSLCELALEMVRRFHRPLVYTAHSLLHLEVGQAPQTRQWCLAQRLLLTLSQHVIFLSRAERDAALCLAPDLDRRSSVVPNGVEPLAKPSAYAAEGPVVFAGRFARTKGLDLLAQVVPQVAAQWHCPFVLAGGHGDDVGERAIQAIGNQTPAALCQVHGWLPAPAVEQLLAGARLVLVPSRYEPFGQTALEAMRVGAPVLAAAVGGLLELVTENAGGLLVDSHDPAVWRQRIGEILAAHDLRRELHQRGPAYVADRFDIRCIARRMCGEVYAGV